MTAYDLLALNICELPVSIANRTIAVMEHLHLLRSKMGSERWVTGEIQAQVVEKLCELQRPHAYT